MSNADPFRLIEPAELMPIANDPEIGRHVLVANLSGARGHLQCAHQHAPVGTDGLTMEHIRAALALVEAVLDGVKQR